MPSFEAIQLLRSFPQVSQEASDADIGAACLVAHAVRAAGGNVLARMASRHVHGVGVDSRGDIYAGLTVDRSVDKNVP